MHQSDSSNSECKRSHVRTSMTAVNHHVCAHPPARPSDSFSSSSLHSNSSDICSPKRLVETADTNNTPRKGEVQQNHQLSALCGFGVCVLLCCGCTGDVCSMLHIFQGLSLKPRTTTVYTLNACLQHFITFTLLSMSVD